jgi:HD-like signal output (HDOD) protein
MTRILFVDDEPAILQAIKRSLRRRREEWDMVFATGGSAALAELRSGPFDIVVSDGRMPDIDGVTLLKQVKAEHPLTIRIILSGHADDETMIPVLPTIHQFLSKPCETRVLESVLESALEVSKYGVTEAMREALLTADWLPPQPRLYAELTRALRDPRIPMASTYAIIERDASLTAALLKMVNSAYFGLRRTVSSVAEAARLLGVMTVRCIALFAEAFAHLGATARVDRAYLEWFHAHSFLTARIAGALASGSRVSGGAFTAGLLHDMGALLIATRIPDEHERLRATIASGGASTVHAAEPKGMTHAELGGWLLAHWGLPAFIVESASRHHGPVSVARAEMDLSDFVHVADCLASELAPGPEGAAHAAIEAPLVDGAQAAARLDKWRRIAERVARSS